MAKKTKKKAKKKTTKKKAKTKKKCLHNILTRQKYSEPWYCSRCRKKMSAAEMSARMPHD
jgi:hypothetical protein